MYHYTFRAPPPPPPLLRNQSTDITDRLADVGEMTFMRIKHFWPLKGLKKKGHNLSFIFLSIRFGLIHPRYPSGSAQRNTAGLNKSTPPSLCLLMRNRKHYQNMLDSLTVGKKENK